MRRSSIISYGLYDGVNRIEEYMIQDTAIMRLNSCENMSE